MKITFVIAIITICFSKLVFCNQNKEETKQKDDLQLVSDKHVEDSTLLLVVFIIGLKRFVHDVEFDSKAFSTEAPVIQNTLYDILHKVNTHKEKNEELSAHSIYAKKLFDVMSDAVLVLKAANFRGQAYQLLRNMVQINVAFLTLPIYDESSDSDFKDYKSTISSYASMMYRWRADFNDLKNVPILVQNMFDSQFAHAEHSLWVLLKTVPKDT